MDEKKSHFKELLQCRLNRDPNTNEYTLGNSEFDRLYGINDAVVLAPDSENVARLGAIAYLMGMVDYEITAFVAVAAGYLATFKDIKTDETKTFLVSSYERDNLAVINELYESKSCKLIDKRKYPQIKESIVDIAWLWWEIESLDKNTVKEIVKELKFKIDKEEKEYKVKYESEYTLKDAIARNLETVLNEKNIMLLDEVKAQIAEYFYKVLHTSLSFTKIDDDNCEKNNLIICRAIFDDDHTAQQIYEIFNSMSNKDFGVLKEMDSDDFKKVVTNYFANSKTESELSEISSKLEIFIGTYIAIIERYFEYIAINKEEPLNNNSELLNEITKKMEKRFPRAVSPDSASKYYMMCIALINLCATDYTAVAAGKFLRSISGIDEYKLGLDQTKINLIPQTSDSNPKDKIAIAQDLYRTTPFRRHK